MNPESSVLESGVLIVTGSTLRAEQADRPLAYRLQEAILNLLGGENSEEFDYNTIVLSDLWYLNSEPLHHLPMVSIGGPSINAVSAHLSKKLPSVLVVDDTLLIQMDLTLQDLRVCVWGDDHAATVDALNIFIHNGYLERFLQAVAARAQGL